MILTRTNAEALRRIKTGGSLAWCKGRGRAGGAVSRMFDRMAEHGWCTPVPHEITETGVEALRQFDLGVAQRIGYCMFCKRSHPGGRTCMGHHP